MRDRGSAECKNRKELMVRGDKRQENITDEADGVSVKVSKSHQSLCMLTASLNSNCLMCH